ncbi:hypothetical protein [Tsuneonella mangrovi]|uniref:hypothetical protein n=1 Tax=Tsuneonella mangrovi TaxID=1982042 RepID=UPI00123722AF|nr:hypothetical protein [Tsuneonella mangrovi]
MTTDRPKSVSMLRFNFAFWLVEITAAGAAGLYTLKTGNEPPITSTPIMIIAIGLALLWYGKAVNRPMTGLEISKFSIGNMVADLINGVAWMIAMILVLDVPFSWEGVSIALGGEVSGHSAKIAVLIGLIVGEGGVAITSAFFAWLISRKLPKPISAAEKFNAAGRNDV